jgi:hypothetical protein
MCACLVFSFCLVVCRVSAFSNFSIEYFHLLGYNARVVESQLTFHKTLAVENILTFLLSVRAVTRVSGLLYFSR